MRIAVSGNNGFIGRHVVNKLKASKDINLTLFDKDKNNLQDFESLKDFVQRQDVVLHIAGINRGTNHELLETNTVGVLSLADAVAAYSPNTRIVFASTSQVYLPQSLYGLSKKFAEDILEQYGLTHKLKSTTLRLSNVYGPGGKPFYNSVIATFAHQIKNDQPLKINGDGSSQRDYIYIEDVADAFVKAALFKQEETTEIFDICSAHYTSLKEIIENFEKLSDKKVEVIYNEAEKDSPWPTKDKNYQKAKEVLGWKPETNLETGLKTVLSDKQSLS